MHPSSIRPRQAALPRQITLVLALAFATAAANARALEDQYGRIQEVELIAHWGVSTGFVKIKKGSKLLSVKTDVFSQAAQEEIAAWMRASPEALAPLVDPPNSGQGLVGGSQWYIVKKGSRSLVEFTPTGLIKFGDNVDQSSSWDVTRDKHLTAKWSRSDQLTFNKALIGRKVYATRGEKPTMLVKRDRLPAPVTSANVTGKTYVLLGAKPLTQWGFKKRSLAVFEFKEGGVAISGSSTFKWSVVGGSINLVTESGTAVTFRGLARDISIDKTGDLLWEVPPPDLK